MMLVVNLVVTAFVVLALRWKTQPGTAMIKQLGLLELMWICFLLMVGLYYVFSTLEIKNSNQSFAEAAGTEITQIFYILGFFLLAHLIVVGMIVKQVITARNR